MDRAAESGPGSARTAFVLGVDVGTGSVRAGVFDLEGRLRGHDSRAIETLKPQGDFCEQSSEAIWRACGEGVRGALLAAGVSPEGVVGLSFDATSCSLVALDDRDAPVTVSPSGDDRWNVVLWMDHRAIAEADAINALAHEVLRYVGGRISPEMAAPKLLWIKKNLPGSWRRARRFLDLTDFLCYRATGVDVRSMCTTVCKWTYLGHETDAAGQPGRWDEQFFRSIGLEGLFDRDRQGAVVRPMGESAGTLTAAAARDLGLAEGTAVGVGAIDAHAGGIGLLGAAIDDPGAAEERLEHALALIGGTSSCHMAVSREPRYIPGVWGPYYSAMIPGMWLTEGGQSATGSLVDHVLADAEARSELTRRAQERGGTIYEILNDTLQGLGEGVEGGISPTVTRDLHVLPYFHGNRSPRADASLRGVISGLTLDRSIDSLARRYLAAVQAVAYGTRHIIDALNAAGYRIDTVLVCGGGTKNPVWLQEHADVTGCRLHLPREPEAVLLGSAILAAVAAGRFPSVTAAMKTMGGSERTVEPRRSTGPYHDRKYRVFHRMYDQFLEIRAIMDDTSDGAAG